MFTGDFLCGAVTVFIATDVFINLLKFSFLYCILMHVCVCVCLCVFVCGWEGGLLTTVTTMSSH